MPAREGTRVKLGQRIRTRRRDKRTAVRRELLTGLSASARRCGAGAASLSSERAGPVLRGGRLRGCGLWWGGAVGVGGGLGPGGGVGRLTLEQTKSS